MTSPSPNIITGPMTEDDVNRATDEIVAEARRLLTPHVTATLTPEETCLVNAAITAGMYAAMLRISTDNTFANIERELS